MIYILLFFFYGRLSQFSYRCSATGNDGNDGNGGI